MRLQVKGKNVEVTPSIREYAERKLAKLEKQLAEQTQVEVELSEQQEPVDRGQPRRRGDDLHERADAARARGVTRHEGVDRPARRQARAAGQALPRDADRSSRGATPSTTATAPDGLCVAVPARASRCTQRWPRRAALARRDERRTPPALAAAAARAGTASSAASRGSTASRARGAGTRSRPLTRRACAATSVRFVALPDGTLVVEEDEPEPDAGAARRRGRGERSRRRTVRRRCGDGRTTWAVAAQRIAVVAAPGLDGDEAELVVTRERADADRRRAAPCSAARPRSRRPARRGHGVRRAGRSGSTATSGRSRRRLVGARVSAEAGTLSPMSRAGHAREGPSLRRGPPHEAPRRAGGVHRDARARVHRSSPTSELRAKTVEFRAAARERRGARRACSSRRSPPCARRACASPTSASSTSR